MPALTPRVMAMCTCCSASGLRMLSATIPTFLGSRRLCL
jgi:hypothetical protein